MKWNNFAQFIWVELFHCEVHCEHLTWDAEPTRINWTIIWLAMARPTMKIHMKNNGTPIMTKNAVKIFPEINGLNQTRIGLKPDPRSPGRTFKCFRSSIWKSKRWNHTSGIPDWVDKTPIFGTFDITFHHSHFWYFVQIVHLIYFFDERIELIFWHNHQLYVFTSRIIRIK